jgi:hypothetical protein
MQLSLLERNVLAKLLSGDDPLLAALRAQLPELVVTERENTGVGFYVNFSGPVPAASISHLKLTFGDVDAMVEGLTYGAGFLLYVKDGRIVMLEGHTYGEMWPEGEVVTFHLKYSDERRQKLSLLLDSVRRQPS